MSTHITREGAEKALEKHKTKCFMNWEEEINDYMTAEHWVGFYETRDKAIEDRPFGMGMSWYISETELLD